MMPHRGVGKGPATCYSPVGSGSIAGAVSAFDEIYTPTEEHQAFRAAVREVCDEKVAPHAAEADELGEFPKASYEALRAADFHAPHVPEEYGGVGGDALATAIVIEEIARACASSSLIPAVNKLASMPWLLAGSDELKQRYLPPLARGDAMASYCLSEPEAGSDAAEHDDPGGARRRRLGAQRRQALDHQRRRLRLLHRLRRHRPGRSAPRGSARSWWRRPTRACRFGAPEKKLGIKGSPTREVYLDNVRIPGDRLIGAEGTGFGTAMKTLDHTRVTIAAQAVGIAQGALDYALGYVKERQQFGKAIAEFQGLQFMLADMGMKLEAARQLTYAAAAKSERGDADLTYFGAAAKCFASDVAMEITTDAVQLLGGYGYTKDYPVERMMRDAKITQIYEGTNQVQRIVMARQLLAGLPKV